MAREPHAWFRQQTGWWMTTIDREKIKLIKGKDKKGEANKKLRELLTLRDHNPSPESGALTVAAVIDLYLTHAKTKLSVESLYNRKLYLQCFAEAHGFRRVNDKDCLPFHLTIWLDAHPEWASDWTKSHAIAVIHRPFNWAAKQRLIAANPFRGVSHRAGAPRRPMTDEEFDALLKAADAGSRKPTANRYPSGRKVCPSDRNRRKGPSAADRFRELLRFLRLTGARPGEASHLEWSHIDLDAAVIVLTVHKTSRTQRQPKPRVIPLTQEVVDLLTAIRRGRSRGRGCSAPSAAPHGTAATCQLADAAGEGEGGYSRRRQALRTATRIRHAGHRQRRGHQDAGRTHGTQHRPRMTEHYLNRLGDHGGHLAAAMRKVSPPAAPASATPPAIGQRPDSEKHQPPSEPAA